MVRCHHHLLQEGQIQIVSKITEMKRKQELGGYHIDILVQSIASLLKLLIAICALPLTDVNGGGGETLQISQEARSIFESTWDKLVAQVGEENLQVPKEIVWLNGAPGAGVYLGAENDICGLP